MVQSLSGLADTVEFEVWRCYAFASMAWLCSVGLFLVTWILCAESSGWEALQWRYPVLGSVGLSYQSWPWLIGVALWLMALLRMIFALGLKKNLATWTTQVRSQVSPEVFRENTKQWAILTARIQVNPPAKTDAVIRVEQGLGYRWALILFFVILFGLSLFGAERLWRQDRTWVQIGTGEIVHRSGLDDSEQRWSLDREGWLEVERDGEKIFRVALDLGSAFRFQGHHYTPLEHRVLAEPGFDLTMKLRNSNEFKTFGPVKVGETYEFEKYRFKTLGIHSDASEFGTSVQFEVQGGVAPEKIFLFEKSPDFDRIKRKNAPVFGEIKRRSPDHKWIFEIRRWPKAWIFIPVGLVLIVWGMVVLAGRYSVIDLTWDEAWIQISSFELGRPWKPSDRRAMEEQLISFVNRKEPGV